jgi:hypothetical protein
MRMIVSFMDLGTSRAAEASEVSVKGGVLRIVLGVRLFVHLGSMDNEFAGENILLPLGEGWDQAGAFAYLEDQLDSSTLIRLAPLQNTRA